jgi:flagellar motor switch protein FliM
VGDIIPIDAPNALIVNVKKIPVFKGRLGESNGNYAVKLTDKVINENAHLVSSESRLAHFKNAMSKKKT